MFVDSHCHLSFPELSGQIGAIRAAMRQARVVQALCICTTLEEFDAVHGLATAHDDLWCTVGVHPDTEGLAEPTLEDLVERSRRPRVVGIGETGLDYYRLNGRTMADMAWQRARFRVHLDAARRTGLPLVIHTRSASEDTMSILGEYADMGLTGVFHCFTETLDVARAAVDLGFHISFSGILTFKNARELRDVARWVPLERCLIETDSPYLAPVPHRGQMNTPALVPLVAAALASLKGYPVEDVAAITSTNFRRLFAIPGDTTWPGGT